MDTLAPIHIKPLLEIYCFPIEEDRHYCNQHIYGELLAMELIQERSGANPGNYGIYEISERGHVYCTGLSDIPLPRKQWVMQS